MQVFATVTTNNNSLGHFVLTSVSPLVDSREVVFEF